VRQPSDNEIHLSERAGLFGRPGTAYRAGIPGTCRADDDARSGKPHDCVRFALLARRVLPPYGDEHSNRREPERKRFLAVAAAAATLAASAGVVSANHIRIESPVPATPPPTAVIVPVPAPTQTVQADEIRAGVVRANVIYANKIEADQVRGTVHQTHGVKVRDSQGKIKAPEVVASTIYADTISANTVDADTIYVRELDRH